ncbi:hypothetical protein CONPUDRAFT_160471 [Coniophora puteana RWD-64-598 SS2]|uniref:Uncharacterized protein n=1 Tax=Coniophora puteana (strain RWD-64-598) TaxID=741705 RepID=R7SE00_CONPW|nr:uncharacterized protein CONPUDRAFT_160471 [Coniophora puteana RWD-64-598 SS2]EIW73977.1 hypothetical protein CONPUDRAFT_160471 [Coniophora puteana RWD-64-598 SS2]
MHRSVKVSRNFKFSNISPEPDTRREGEQLEKTTPKSSTRDLSSNPAPSKNGTTKSKT